MGEQGMADGAAPRRWPGNFVLNRAWFWLAVQGLVLLAVCVFSESFQLFPVDMDGYWASVRSMEVGGLRGPDGILTNIRAFGYPLLLKLVTLLTPSLEALPFVHVALRVLAVIAFYAGLRGVGLRPWLALAAASPLFYANAIFSHDGHHRVTLVLTDAQGESLVILTVGLLLLVLSRPRSVAAWLGFTVSLFFTYQVRPTYQMQIVVLPVLGFVLLGLVAPRPEWLRLRWRVGLGLLAVSWVPYLAWTTMRLFLVGHFGLACVTGYQMCAVAGNFISEDVVQDVPEDLRPYLECALANRDQIVRGELATTFGAWRPAFDENGRLLPGILEDDELFCLVAHDLFYNASQTVFGPDPVVRDRMQIRTALALIKARPWYYWQWVVGSLKSMPAKIFWSNLVLKYLGMVLALVTAAWYAAYVFRRLRSGPEAVAGTGIPFAGEVNLLFVIALSIAGSQGLVLAMTSSSSYGSRYCDSLGVFLPSVAVVVLLALLRRIGDLVGLPGGSALRGA